MDDHQETHMLMAEALVMVRLKWVIILKHYTKMASRYSAPISLVVLHLKLSLTSH